MPISFILNENLVRTSLPPGTVLVDFIRYHQHLTGTKIGCREGDCGACSIVCGELRKGELHYQTMTSCLMPLGNAAGKHIVTIEGINTAGLNPLQQAMHDEAATQCGFCTPGIVVSLAGFCLRSNTQNTATTPSGAITSVDGNICRCTGYKSIERAAARVTAMMEEKNGEDPIEFLISRGVLPAYFKHIRERLASLSIPSNRSSSGLDPTAPKFVGGGTDLYVQQHQAMVHAQADFILNQPEMKGIIAEGGKCIIGASSTVSDLIASAVFREHFPEISGFIKLVSSTPIRNMATVAGNFVNASPIGDLTIFFLALDAKLLISNGDTTRELPLRQFYKAYKTLDKKAEEYIEKIWFDLPGEGSFFNFEKVSKRTYLDIASVNSAILIRMQDQFIADASLSAGGVGPIPLFLTKTSAFMKGKELSVDLVSEANKIAQGEISPISDARGTVTYKRLLLKQLLKAHFITMFPSMKIEQLITG